MIDIIEAISYMLSNLFRFTKQLRNQIILKNNEKKPNTNLCIIISLH